MLCLRNGTVLYKAYKADEYTVALRSAPPECLHRVEPYFRKGLQLMHEGVAQISGQSGEECFRLRRNRVRIAEVFGGPHP